MDSLESVLNLIRDYLNENKRRTTVILISTASLIWLANRIKVWINETRYFKRLNIKGPMPLPIIGNLHEMVKRGLPHSDVHLIKTYGPTVGYFEGSLPVILTTDTKLIKSVMIKDFNNFVNRRVFEGILFDPLDKFMTALKDDEWKNVRSIITTSFTSGKLKSMSQCMSKCTESIIEYLEETLKKDEGFDAKTVFGCYTLDVISSCCFGIEINSINNQNSEFIKNLQAIFDSSLSKNPKILLLFLFPKFSRFLSRNNLIEFIPVGSYKYIQTLTDQVIELRRSKKERRDDFIQNIVDHENNSDETTSSQNSNDKDTDNKSKSKSTKKTLTNSEIIAQALLFLTAGYETTANTIVFIAYNLAMNSESQQKLIEEVDQVLEKFNGEVTYEAVNEMPYMDMVIDETLRMYPPVIRIDRVCNKDYQYGDIKIPKGQAIAAAIWSLHYDPNIYPQPEKFIPERFSDDEKKLRDNEAYLPFGAGPRNCIGMRFATLEIKTLLSKLLSKYVFIKCEKTTETIELESSGLTRPLKPIILKIKPRF